jgi:hypothetical protein
MQPGNVKNEVPRPAKLKIPSLFLSFVCYLPRALMSHARASDENEMNKTSGTIRDDEEAF